METIQKNKKTISSIKHIVMGAFLLSGISINSQVLNYNTIPIVDAAKIWGFSGDGGLAINAKITMPCLGGIDANGTLFFSDRNNYRIRKVNITNIINTIGGNGTSAYTGDGGPVNACQFSSPGDLTLDAVGNKYVIDGANIRRIDAVTNIITTIAGTGVTGFSGDGGPAINAQIAASKIKCDNAGNIYFNDFGNRLRKVDISTGIINTVCGSGVYGFSGDGGLATLADISVSDFVIDNFGNIFLNGGGRIRKVDAITHIINTICGTGVQGNTGDGGLAVNAQINGGPLAIDNSNNVLIADWDITIFKPTIRKINSSGIIDTYIIVNGSPFLSISQIDINPISSYPIVTFYAVCMVDASIYELRPSIVIPPVNNLTASNSGRTCRGGSIQLYASANLNGTFSWAGPNGFTSNQQNPILNNIDISANGVYTVTSTNAQGVVTATTSAVILNTKNLNPKVTSTICEGGLISLEALDASGSSYQWKGPNGFIANSPNAFVVEATTNASGIYTLSMVDNVGCISNAKVNAMVYPKPSIDIDMTKAIAGCQPLNNIEFKAVTSQNITNFSWDLGNNIKNFINNPKNLTYQNAGTYSISLLINDANGCSNSIVKTLEVYPTPIIDFSNTSNASYANPNVQFKDLSVNGNIKTWFWTFGLGPDVYSNQQHPSYTYQDSGTYNVTLKVKTDKGCENMISKKVRIADETDMFVPNAFSPNGDGNNDSFFAISNNTTKFNMQIFNRWGNLVFQSNDIKKGWDGTYKGELGVEGVYNYKISYATASDSRLKSIVGNLTVVR